MSKNTLTVAVAQAGSIYGDTAATIDKLEQITSDAAQLGAKLILFPEVFVGGYPRGEDFGAVVGSRTSRGRSAFQRYWEGAIDLPGPEFDRLSQIARDNSIHLVTGVLERDGGTVYCTVLFFAADGTYLGKHRKLMPTAMERLVWGYGDGSTMPVFETEVGRIGAVICWENYMPLMRFHMYSQNIEIYLAPTADNRPEWAPSMQHIAQEGRCFVLACNQFTTLADFPDDHHRAEGTPPDTVLSNGGSCIVGPSGEFIVEPAHGGEELLIATLELDEIPRWKYDFDVVGHYSRPDVFSLHVDTTARAVAHSTPDAPAATVAHLTPAPTSSVRSSAVSAETDG